MYNIMKKCLRGLFEKIITKQLSVGKNLNIKNVQILILNIFPVSTFSIRSLFEGGLFEINKRRNGLIKYDINHEVSRNTKLDDQVAFSSYCFP